MEVEEEKDAQKAEEKALHKEESKVIALPIFSLFSFT